jgi:hypothetical protein
MTSAARSADGGQTQLFVEEPAVAGELAGRLDE